jgi:hypothetical protein
VRFDLREGNGAPFQGSAKLWVRQQDTDLLHWEAWEQGPLDWTLNPDLRYDVRVSARGRPDLHLDAWTPPRDGTPVVLRLEPALALQGRVVDPAGGPLRAHEVRVAGQNSATTAADGRFEVRLLRPGRGQLVVRRVFPESGSAGLDLARLDVDCGVGDLGDVVAAEPARVAAQVVDEGGRPLGGVAVRTLPEGAATTTRADGCFELDVPPLEGFHLLLTRPGFGDTAVLARTPPARAVLPRASAARVEVRFPPGHGKRGFWVVVENASGAAWRKAYDATYLHGEATTVAIDVADLPPGPLTFRLEGVEAEDVRATVAPDRPSEVRFAVR